MYKVLYQKRDGEIFIHCPKCRTEQILPLEKEWYEIDIRGNVSPVFVCMANDRKCTCMMDIQLENWKR